MTLNEANTKLYKQFGKDIFIIIEEYQEDDGTIRYRYFYYDGLEITWDGFKTVEEAYIDLCIYLNCL